MQRNTKYKKKKKGEKQEPDTFLYNYMCDDDY